MTKQYRRIFTTPSRVNTDILCLKNIVQYYTVALTSPGFRVLRTKGPFLEALGNFRAR